MTLTEIDETVARFVAAGRRNIPVPISEWREMMATKSIGKVSEKALAKGKVKPVVKASASQRIGRKAKADRQEKAWKGTRVVMGTVEDGIEYAGRVAFGEGRALDRCPYDGRTNLAKHWKAGWHAAAKDSRRANAAKARGAK